MQTESISLERRAIRNGYHEAANGMCDEVSVERDFLPDRFSLRAQFDWKVARRSIDREVQDEGTGARALTTFQSPAERIFTRNSVMEFLGQLRKKAARRVCTRHASTPQILVFRKGHHSWIERDASIAPWRYMYFMGPRGSATSTAVVIQTREAIFELFPWLKRTRTAKVIAGPNDLIMYRSVAVQSVLWLPDSVELKDQTIVLSGWLW
jgi:hypothetical protein